MSQAVKIYVPLTNSYCGSEQERNAILNLEDQLRDTVAIGALGELDGVEYAEDHCIIYIYGQDADAILEKIYPSLRNFPMFCGGFVVKRYGEPGSPEVKINSLIGNLQ